MIVRITTFCGTTSETELANCARCYLSK